MKLNLCHFPGCNELTQKFYCKKHSTKKNKAYRHREWHSLYNTSRWKKEKRKFLLQYPLCVNCGKEATTVDHITPHRGNELLFFDKFNWQPMCQSCHSRKTIEEKRRRGDI